ncbi:hypothetical protein Syun_012971 [Stephania yunnanensis]|uniref:Uncharacterized protein n=1 Tax=Stephania yunnanensis TaxID=152371 RepID=A0AAP0K0H7_9MAGN
MLKSLVIRCVDRRSFPSYSFYHLSSKYEREESSRRVHQRFDPIEEGTPWSYGTYHVSHPNGSDDSGVKRGPLDPLITLDGVRGSYGDWRRKRPSASDFYDAAAPTTVSSGLATAPAGLVPMWVGGGGAVIPAAAGAFWMIPQAAAVGGPSPGQIWAAFPPGAAVSPIVNISGRPISSFVTAMQQPIELGRQSEGAVCGSSSTSLAGAKSGKASTMAPPSSSTTTASSPSVTTTTTTQLLRDFSLEIYEKQELGFMANNTRSVNVKQQQHQTSSPSKS